MSRLYYFVVELEDAWWVSCPGRLLGPSETREHALEDGIKVATLFGDPTIEVSVIGPDETGSMVTLWQSPSVQRTA